MNADTWYYVKAGETVNAANGQILLSGNGTVHLILGDGAKLTATTMDDTTGSASLVIYGQSAGTGTLEINRSDNVARIYSNSGSVTINGGTVNITSTSSAYIQSDSSVTINGGNINLNSEGISFIQSKTGSVTINGGTVNVTSTNNEAYILSDSSVTINGGTVNVTSKNNKAYIQSDTGLTINGGTVTVTSKGSSSYIWSFNSDVTISGGQVTVTGKTTDDDKSGIICGGSGSITLGYTNGTDFILASGYYSNSYGSYTAIAPKIADGKTFAVLTGDATLEKVIDSSTSLKANELDGKKLVPTLSVTFNANSGTGTMNPQTFASGVAQALTANAFTRTGYTFKEWNTQQDGSGTSYADGAQATLTADVTLYAQWTPETYKITYEPNGGTNDSANPASYTVDDAITLKAPTKTGYEFAGWTLDGKAVTEIKDLTGDITLTATWTPVTYSITYNLDGGSATNPASYTIESESFTLSNPTKDGYTFTGWSGTDLTGEANTAVTIAKGSTGNREYTAHYAAGLSTIEVSVTGALTLTTTEGTATTSAYTASVTGKYSDGTSTALTDYSIEWTLDKNISGIQISNNGTLSVNNSVSAGTYALTITAKATQGSITGSGTRSINLTVNAQQQEETSPTATLESLNVSITGSDSLIVTEQETLTQTYTASVTGTYSDNTSKALTASDYSLEWTLEPSINGVSLSDGTLRVSDSALAGKYTFTITAKATQDSITGSGTKSVNLEVLERRKTTDAEYLDSLTPEEKNAVEYLALSDNPDKQITDLSQIDFTDFTNLNTLDLSELKNLEQADLSQLPDNVKTVNLEKTNITSLNLNGSKVEKVNANGCKNLMNIDAENNESLTDLDVSDTNITVINVKNCASLQTLNCASCDIEAGNLNLEGCKNLVSLDISRNHFGWFDYDPSNLSSMTNFDCYSQDINILESTTTFNFGRFFNSGDITVAGVRVMASAYIDKIGSLTAYNESGDKIASEYDPQTGIATFESAPAVIKYLYDTGFDDLSMDVTINALTHEEPEPETDNLLGPSSGCDSGLGVYALILAAFLITKKL